MARKPSPWYRAERNEWCVHYNGELHRLGSHPEGARTPQRSRRTGKWNTPEAIEEEFFKLIGQKPTQPVKSDHVIVILDDFILWCRENREDVTAKRYEEFCQSFVQFETGEGLLVGELLVSQLSSKHVTQWLTKYKWGPTTKRNAITAIQRGFNWAVKNRGLEKNPIHGMEKPQARNRTGLVVPQEFAKLIKAIPDARFRELLTTSYDSGARPFEIKDLEKRHIQTKMQRAVLPKDEAKGRKHPRTIYFPTERTMEIIQRLCEEHPTGPLFRNRLGNKWTGLAVKCRLQKYDHILGRRIRHYDLRHGFITRKLVAGVDSHVVAKLAGHRDTRMIDTVYSHVADDFQFMLREARKDVK